MFGATKIKLNGLSRSVASFALLVGLASCGGSSGYSGNEIKFSEGTFAETLVEARVTSDFAKIFISVVPSLTADQVGAKTLFAPSNSAVEKYLIENSETIEGMISKPEVALSFVLSHLFGQKVSATELLNMNGEELAMVSGSLFTIGTKSGAIQLISESGLKSSIIAIDLVSTDGIVHIVDAVLQP